jgi:replicative DNA helicase Mcm
VVIVHGSIEASSSLNTKFCADVIAMAKKRRRGMTNKKAMSSSASDLPQTPYSTTNSAKTQSDTICNACPSVNAIRIGSQKRYQLPEDLQQLGYTQCLAFSHGKIALFFKGKPILIDLSREGWEEKFERTARRVIGARIEGKSNNNTHVRQIVQEGISLLATVYVKRMQQQLQLPEEGGDNDQIARANNSIADDGSSGDIHTGAQPMNASAAIHRGFYPDDTLITQLDRLDKPITVKKAIRRHFGRVVIGGIVTSTSNLYNLVKNAQWLCTVCGNYTEKKVRRILDPPPKPTQCPYCQSKQSMEDAHQYINAVTLHLQDDDDNGITGSDNNDDDDKENDLNTLPVVIFENDTWHNPIGENVKVIGDIEKVQDKKTKKYHTYLVARAIYLQQRKRQTLTGEDIASIKRFAGFEPIWGGKCLLLGNSVLLKRLISMFAPNIICDDNKKLVQLLVAVGAPEDEYHRGRINELLVGPPGTGKTKLAKEAMKLRLNSRYVSSKNTTGLSLTAMILKENETYTVHLGPVPLSKNAICVVNELDKLEPEKQDNLLDVMEEGMITLNKFARLKNIRSSTTIIATANPQNNRWVNPGAIAADEIPIELTKLSRFDIVLIFESIKDMQDNRKFADAKTSYDRKKIKHNYNFLVKYIEYGRTIDPTITPEAQSMLNEYWARLSATEGLFVTPRLLEALGRLAKALARLFLQKVADVDIAKRVIDLVNSTMIKFLAAIDNITDPRALAYRETINIIRQQQGKPIDLIEAVRMACQKNEQLRYYLGIELDQSRNKKVRELCNRIVENKSIARVKIRPLVVRWEEDGDGSRRSNNDNNPPSTGNDAKVGSSCTPQVDDDNNNSIAAKPDNADTESHGSQRSQTPDRQSSNAFTCDPCDLCDRQNDDDADNSSHDNNSRSLLLEIPEDIKRNLPDCVAFDSEWESDSHTLTAAAFVDIKGNRRVLQLSDFGGSERDLVLAYVNELTRYEASVGWGTFGFANAIGTSSGGKIEPRTMEGGVTAAA